jgi:hypothetical protein
VHKRLFQRRVQTALAALRHWPIRSVSAIPFQPTGIRARSARPPCALCGGRWRAARPDPPHPGNGSRHLLHQPIRFPLHRLHDFFPIGKAALPRHPPRRRSFQAVSPSRLCGLVRSSMASSNRLRPADLSHGIHHSPHQHASGEKETSARPVIRPTDWLRDWSTDWRGRKGSLADQLERSTADAAANDSPPGA